MESRLSEIKNNTLDEINVENETEATAVESYGEVKSAKKTEISALLNQFLCHSWVPSYIFKGT